VPTHMLSESAVMTLKRRGVCSCYFPASPKWQS